MTDPKRWSNPSSEVDPVLRSVLRYARELEPSASETQSLLRRVEAAEHASANANASVSVSVSVSASRGRVRRSARPVRARAIALSAALGAAVGSVAFAGYAVHQAQSQATQAPLASRRVESQKPKRGVGARLPALSPTPAASAPLAELLDPSEMAERAPEIHDAARGAAHATKPAPPVASADSAASLRGEAELLQSARASLTADPVRALRMTQEHAARFPNSTLTEERSALEVEALLRVGRSAEANAALVRFETAHPRSPYRRRLRGLLPSSP